MFLCFVFLYNFQACLILSVYLGFISTDGPHFDSARVGNGQNDIICNRNTVMKVTAG